jgi:hypothetical protein
VVDDKNQYFKALDRAIIIKTLNTA